MDLRSAVRPIDRAAPRCRAPGRAETSGPPVLRLTPPVGRLRFSPSLRRCEVIAMAILSGCVKGPDMPFLSATD